MEKIYNLVVKKEMLQKKIKDSEQAEAATETNDALNCVGCSRWVFDTLKVCWMFILYYFFLCFFLSVFLTF